MKGDYILENFEAISERGAIRSLGKNTRGQYMLDCLENKKDMSRDCESVSLIARKLR